jgi:Tol biopolymer transport system component/tRNA A-37 threonylcarbamoyl transferase component Bud32
VTESTARLAAALADRYTIERELGAGGMATVYLAQDLKHDRQVAIKVLREDLSASLGAGRFLREIKIAAQLQHPHILPLLDSGEADGFLFFVMPYIKGQSLRERLEREGELPVHEAVRLITEVVDALVEAHEHGVVHRDIKPDNVMLSGRHALVTDFGVAKAISEATGRNTVTTLGVAVGTPTYMSPEQAAADPHVDHRSDIYSVGVMAYEMLSGRPPFTGSTPQQVLAAHVTEAPDSVSKRRPAIPAAIEAVVMRCLAKRPADRFQTAAELHAALEPLATPSGGLTPTATEPIRAVVGARRFSGISRAAALAAGVIAVAAAAYWFLNRPPAVAVVTSNTQLTRAAGVEESPVISPDGKSVAYMVLGPADSTPHVEFRRTDGGDAVPIAGGRAPAGWSPSGDRLLVAGLVGGLSSQPALGGQATVIDPKASFGCWSPDGKQVAFVVNDSLFVGGLNGEKPRFLAYSLQTNSPAWSPDGKWIAFVSGNIGYFLTYNIAPSSIWLVPAQGGMARALTPADGLSMSPTWAPDSRRLLIVSSAAGVRDVYQLDLTSNGKARGAPVRITTGLNPSLISLSADGTTLAYSVATYPANIWKTPLPTNGSVSTRGALPVTSDRQTIEAFNISRDGKWLVFDSDREGVQQIFRMPLGGGAAQQLTHDSNPSFNPAISPDGKEVAYHAILKGLRRAFTVPIEGGRSVQVSPGASPDERNAFWSPDGHRLAWQLVTGLFIGRWQVQFATRDAAGKWGGISTVSFPSGKLALAWADQGTALIAIDSLWRIGRLPVAGGPFELLNGASVPDPFAGWTGGMVASTDGKTLYFVRRNDPRGLRTSVLALSLADGQMHEVLRFDEPSRPHSIASQGIAEYDGWLYFTLSDFQSDIWVATVKGLRK